MTLKSIEERLAALETEVKIYHCKLDKLLENEFPHLVQDVIGLREQQRQLQQDMEKWKRLLYAILTTLVSGVVGLIFAIIKGHLRF